MNGRPSGLLSSNPSAVLKSLPASSIKDIEVITDPGARYDAEGMSGIINIVMVRRVLDGYTGTVSAEVTAERGIRRRTFVSLKAGKLGLTANYNLEYEREPIADITSFARTYRMTLTVTSPRSGSIGKGEDAPGIFGGNFRDRLDEPD